MSDRDFKPSKRLRLPWLLGLPLLALGLFFCIAVWPHEVHSGWLNSARLDELKTEYNKHPDDDETAMYYSFRLAQDGSLDESRQIMEKVVRHNPNSAKYWLALGQSEAHCGRSVEAAKAYQKSLALDPSQTSIRSFLGQLYGEAGLLTDALEQFDMASSRDSRVKISPEVWATCLLKKGRFAQGWKVLDQSIQEVPHQDTTYEILTDIGIKMKNFDETEFYLVRRIDMESEYPHSRYQSCISRVELARPRSKNTLEKAEVWARAAVREKTPEARYFAGLSEVQVLRHEYAQAKDSLKKGLEIDSKDAQCLRDMADLLETENKKQEAAAFRARYEKVSGETAQIVRLRKAIETTPQNIGSYIQLSDALERELRYGEAAEICHAALEHAGTNAEINTRLDRCRQKAIEKLGQESLARAPLS